MQEHYADYLDFYRRGPYAPHLIEHRLAGSAPVRLLSIAQPAGHYPDPPTGDVTVQMFTRGQVAAEADCGAGRFRFQTGPGVFGVAPHDGPGSYLLDGHHELLILAVPSTSLIPMLDEVSPGFRGDFGWLHAATTYDPLIEHLCRRLWAEAEQQGPLGTLFADSALQTLMLALLRLSGSRPMARPSAGLSSHQLGRVLGLLHARLSENVSLADLAAEAGMGPTHFARAFRQTVGMPPYRYLLQKRVEHARTLLATTSLPIAEIALDCGFCHQEHLTSVFRRLTGTTPNAYRRETRL